ncbi:MAG: hypothetical protein ACKO5K_17035 [Armatimonadota bacterium]
MSFLSDLIDWVDWADHIVNAIRAWRFWVCAAAGGLLAFAAWSLLPESARWPVAIPLAVAGVVAGAVWHWSHWRKT